MALSKIEVTCSQCGFLGTFFITAEHPREGAMARAERLKKGHLWKCTYGEVSIREL